MKEEESDLQLHYNSQMSVLPSPPKKITRHTKKQERMAYLKEWNHLWGSPDIEAIRQRFENNLCLNMLKETKTKTNKKPEQRTKGNEAKDV